MKIKYIEHERTQDAPFIGALIVASDCNRDCKGCFNQHLKQLPNIDVTVNEIISEVKHNPFNEGVILGGLEWMEQISDMMDLISAAKINNLEVMLQTGHDVYPNIPQMYVKYGRYRDEFKTHDNIQYGVKLASSNQNIIYRQ